MKITYYEVYCTGTIHERSIDTTDKNYISHTDNDVTFNDTYTDEYWEQREVIRTKPRFFETIRQERIAAYKEEIARYQEDLAVFENSNGYEHYWQLLKENRSKK
jgi:hypothetical protein